jgi:hypothetical protein
MKAQLTFFLILFGLSLGAQVPDYFEGNPQWRMEWGNGAYYPCIELNDYIYYLSGDTVIGNQVYKKVFERRDINYDWLSAPPPFNCEGSYTYDSFRILIRQDSLKMYVRDLDGIDTLIYDFDIEVGDTLPITYNLYLDDIVVTGIDSLLVGSSFRKVFEIPDYNPAGNNLIEGIGFTTGLLDSFNCPEFPTILQCFVQNDTTYYPYFGDPCDMTVSIPKMDGYKEITYYPNPVINELVVRLNPSASIDYVTCIRSDGQQVEIEFEQSDPQNIVIDFSGKNKGIYILHLHAKDAFIIAIKVLKI